MKTLSLNPERKSKIIILHGAYGYPSENWFAWLKEELSSLGVHCEVPQLPTPGGQSLENWISAFSETAKSIDSASILIGHSLGAAFLLRYLELSSVKIKAAILVGAFIGKIAVPHFDCINESFFTQDFQWEIIQKSSAYFACYHGSNDPYVPQVQFELIANRLKAQKILVPRAGHFNLASGYSTFPQLLSHLKQLMEHN